VCGLAPQGEIQGLKERMGWELIPWYSITDDFDADFGVDDWHGHNVFIRDGDYLDVTALGRQEQWEDSPEGYPQGPPYGWWNYHDAYPKAS
jgi:predicted dithiol-disulfide oxidoreductase (DUF899 family)